MEKKKKKEIAKYIVKNSKGVLLPMLDMNSLKALISKVDLVIGGDTGPTHMAWALNIASIVLFGNTPANRNTYQTKKNKILESNSKVDALKLDKNDFSIREIKEEDILSLAKDILYEKKD